MGIGRRYKIQIGILCFVLISIIGSGIYGEVIKSFAFTPTAGTIVGSNIKVSDQAASDLYICELGDGHGITVVDEADGSDGYQWSNIEFTYNDTMMNGWVRSEFIALEGGEEPMLMTMAAKKMAKVKGTSVNIRAGAGTSNTSIAKLNTGHALEIIGETMITTSLWYQVSFSYEGQVTTGWILASLVTLDTPPTSDVSDAAFEAELEAQGFPESYRVLLRTLHVAHPNWRFKAVQTGLDWNNVIAGETKVVYRNLVPASSLNSWKSLENGAYDWEKNVWYQYENGWVAASKEAIEYYMDPRNFLVDDGRILMFQSLRWEGTEDATGIKTMLSGRVIGTDDFASYFLKAGQVHNASAYHLASRANQETAGGTSGSVTGPYKNYYNIGAYGSNPVAAGIEYAKKQGWDTAEKSIVGGAAFIANNYINKAQDTLYLQKFDVVDGGNGYFAHQYMTNLLAAESEAKTMAKAYADFRNSSVVLNIPVYGNMPATACMQPSTNGNPNNLLNSLSVGGYTLTPSFNKFKDSYDVIVPADVASITVQASPVQGLASMSGIGAVLLKETGITTVKIIVTPSYGPSKTYAINIAKSSDGSGNEGNPGSEVVLGDINADGNINSIDLLYLQRHRVGVIVLVGNQVIAADIDRDGQITPIDVLHLQRHIVGVKPIVQ